MKQVHPLRSAREACSFTQEQLAQRIGIGIATIKRAESGRPISLDSRRRLCEFFEQTPEKLGLAFLDDDEKKSGRMPSTANEALIHYVQRQREHLGAALAPGATKLRVREVIEQGGLFLPPSWRILGGEKREESLIEYLVECLQEKQRVLLLGDAGDGKTTILKLLFSRLAEYYIESPSSPLPFYIPLRECETFTGDPLGLLWAQVGEQFPLSYQMFASLVRKGQTIFLFDGFDEIRSEITQRAINERASCKIFRYDSLLSCRVSFFDFYLALSPLQEHYPTLVELCPLSFNEAITHYITAFCQWKQQSEHGSALVPATTIIQALQHSPILQELAQRPLLLVMMLDLFTDPQELSLTTEWTLTKLYKKYTEKWLKNEAAKPDSALKWTEKVGLLQEVAWATTMGEVATSPLQNTTLSYEELQIISKNALSRYPGLTEAQIVDDLCFRSLLVVDRGASSAFLHKSFQEYYAARYVFDCLRRRDRGALVAIEQVLRASLPFDIATFLKKLLKESTSHEKAVIAHNLISVYQQNQIQKPEPTTIRQQSTYYLSTLRTEQAIRFLEQIWACEPNKWVQRGIMLGLALYSGREDMLERYMQIVYQDDQASAINMRYHLIYYGDQTGNLLDLLDIPEQPIVRSEKTVAALFRHLQYPRYRNGWALDLYTLTTLIEQQGFSVLQSQSWYLPFLMTFLESDQIQDGPLLTQEKQRLSHLIKVELSRRSTFWKK